MRMDCGEIQAHLRQVRDALDQGNYPTLRACGLREAEAELLVKRQLLDLLRVSDDGNLLDQFRVQRITDAGYALLNRRTPVRVNLISKARDWAESHRCFSVLLIIACIVGWMGTFSEDLGKVFRIFESHSGRKEADPKVSQFDGAPQLSSAQRKEYIALFEEMLGETRAGLLRWLPTQYSELRSNALTTSPPVTLLTNLYLRYQSQVQSNLDKVVLRYPEQFQLQYRRFVWGSSTLVETGLGKFFNVAGQKGFPTNVVELLQDANDIIEEMFSQARKQFHEQIAMPGTRAGELAK